MRSCVPLRRALPVLLVPLLTALGVGSAEGQTPRRDFETGMRTGVGYAGVILGVPVGIGMWQMVGSKFGMFADAKMTVGSLRDEGIYCPPGLGQCTVAWVNANRNDVFIRDVDEYRIFNAGGMYTLTREFAVMLGGGVVSRRTIHEFFDESEVPFVPGGAYYVDETTDAQTEVQFVVGMMLRAGNRGTFRFGYESAPGGMSVGIYFVLP